MGWKWVALVLERSQVGPVARMVLVAIAERINNKRSAGRASLTDLARRSGASRAAVVRSLRLLEARGELRIERRAGQPNQYALTLADRSRSETSVGARPVSERDRSGLGAIPDQSRSETRTGGTGGTGSLRVRTSAHTRRRSAARTEPTPDPRIRSLLDAFCERHTETLGQPYRVCGGRDGKHLKDALRLYDEPTIRRTLDAYFADRTARLRFGASVPQFVAQIATLAARTPDRPPLRNFTAERWAEEEAAERAAAAATTTTGEDGTP